MSRKILILLLSALLLVLFFIGYSSDKLVDWLWFKSLRLTEVFWTPLLTGIFTKLILGLGLFLFIFANLSFTKKAYIELNSQVKVTRQQHLFVSIVTAFVLTLFLLSGFSYDWVMIQQFLHRTPVGNADPIFGLDLSFYLFAFPLLQKVSLLSTALIILTFLSVTVSYLVAQAYWFQERRFRLWPRARMHLTVLGVLFLVTKAGGYMLNRFNLLFTEKSLITGVNFAAHHVRILGLNILAVISLVAAALLIWSLFDKRYVKLLITAGGLWLTVSFLAGVLAPQLVEDLYVKPNEYIVEEDYIANHIEMTRFGYGLNQIKERLFIPQNKTAGTNAGVNANANPLSAITMEHPSLRNLRIWDYRPLLPVYNQVQTIRSYYNFNDIDIDRYETPSGQRQVMLSVREIDPARLPPGANNWLNRHLTYTHGYGLAMNPVNEITPNGQPRLIVKDLPPKIDPEFASLDIERPEVYFGETNNDYIVVNTKQKEFDYPRGDQNETTTYQGKDGISLRRFPVRILMAMKLREKNFILSGYINNNSRIILNRQISERVRKIAPFLRFDQDPYAVVSEGRIFWLLDAYTVSSYLPYAKKHNGGFNYIRNSVKVVVDAYNGTVDFYVVDPDDALAQTWQKIFPRLFQDIKKMPEALKKHIRYSERLFTIQRDMLLTYHMTNPRAFYEKEDYWSIPTQIYDSREELMEPHYVTISLPGELDSAGANDGEFVLMQVFTPRNKRNMVSWLAARCDGDKYGELLLYKLPKDANIYGPMQIEARIGQDPEISQRISLWNREQSRLIRGNLLALPLAEGFLYAEPFYILSAQGQIPELKKVVLVYEDSIVMGDNLQEALIKLGDADTAVGAAKGGASGIPAPEEPLTKWPSEEGAPEKSAEAEKEGLTEEEDKSRLSPEDRKRVEKIQEHIAEVNTLIEELKN